MCLCTLRWRKSPTKTLLFGLLGIGSANKGKYVCWGGGKDSVASQTIARELVL